MPPPPRSPLRKRPRVLSLMARNHSDNAVGALGVEGGCRHLAVVQFAVVSRESRVAYFGYRALDRLFLAALVSGLLGYPAALEAPAYDSGSPADPPIEKLGAGGRVEVEIGEVDVVCRRALCFGCLAQDGRCGA